MSDVGCQELRRRDKRQRGRGLAASSQRTLSSASLRRERDDGGVTWGITARPCVARGAPECRARDRGGVSEGTLSHHGTKLAQCRAFVVWFSLIWAVLGCSGDPSPDAGLCNRHLSSARVACSLLACGRARSLARSLHSVGRRLFSRTTQTQSMHRERVPGILSRAEQSRGGEHRIRPHHHTIRTLAAVARLGLGVDRSLVLVLNPLVDLPRACILAPFACLGSPVSLRSLLTSMQLTLMSAALCLLSLTASCESEGMLGREDVLLTSVRAACGEPLRICLHPLRCRSSARSALCYAMLLSALSALVCCLPQLS